MKIKHLCSVIGMALISLTSLLNVSCAKNDQDYLVFEADEDSAVKYVVFESDESFTDTFSLRYSKDRTTWTENWENNDVVDLKKGEKLYLANSTETLNSVDNHIEFKMDGKIRVTGNIYSLINKAELTPYCFYKLFNENGGIVKAPELSATTLANNCYESMFANCCNLVDVPRLFATTLEEGCYKNMFENCVSLKKTPSFDFKEVKEDCAKGMFNNCYALEEVCGNLSASTLTDSCYNGMFNSCNSLVKAPEIAATTMEGTNCLSEMFNGCVFLHCLKVHFPVEYLGGTYTKNWLNNAGSSAIHPIFYSNEIKREEINPGSSTVPSGWDIQTYK